MKTLVITNTSGSILRTIRCGGPQLYIQVQAGERGYVADADIGDVDDTLLRVENSTLVLSTETPTQNAGLRLEPLREPEGTP